MLDGPTAPKPKKARSSIFDLFSKPKVEHARGARDVAVSEPIGRKPSTLSKRAPPRLEPATWSSGQQVLKSSKSTKSLKSARNGHNEPSLQTEHPFEPPPLFQAYPQSVRHTILEAPSSAHAYGGHESESPLEADRRDEPQAMSRTTPAQRVFDKFRTKRNPQTQSSPSQSQHVRNGSFTSSSQQKIYILVTSGYLLQYSGDGKYDRLPECVLKLGPESAAFASDAMEGKHFVLEVVQETRGGFVIDPSTTKPFLSKMGLQTATARRVVSTMFMIFPTAEDMDRWMLVVRKEVAALSGSPVSVELLKPEMVDEQSEPVTKAHRCSTIVRAPSIRSNSSETPVSMTPSSPTLVGSQRTSLATLTGSSTWSSSRSSKQPGPLLPVQEAFNIDSFEDGLGLAGPSSHALFERASPSPTEAQHPSSDRSPLSSAGTGKGGSPPLPMVPSIPAEYAKYKAPASPCRLSFHSYSSHASSTIADLETGRDATQKMTKRHSTIGLADRPTPARTYLSSFAENDDLQTTSSDAVTQKIPCPSPMVDRGEQPAVDLYRTPSMDPISEAPAPVSRTDSPPIQPPVTTPFTSSRVRQTSYTRRASVAIPGEAPASRTVSNRAAKRTSVFARPIPVTISTPTHSSSTSNRVSLQSLSPRHSPNASNRVSLQYIPQNSLLANSRTPVATGMPSSTQSSRSSSSRSSASLESYQATGEPRPNSLQLLEASINYSHSSFPLPSPDLTDPRASTLVPIIRPPSIRPGVRTSRSFHNGGFAVLPLSLPPPKPPPTAPLPKPPSPTTTPPNVQQIAPPVAVAAQ